MKPDQSSAIDLRRDATLTELKKLALRAQSPSFRRPIHWARARVISQNRAIVTVETDKAVLRVNQSKIRRDYDLWHDGPLPRSLEKADKDVPLEIGDAGGGHSPEGLQR